MKAELMRIPEKGLCIVISEFSSFALDQLGLKKKSNGLFNDPYVIADCIKAGQKIAAIKEVRAQVGWGLREAKQYIDKYMPMGIDQTPDRCLNWCKLFLNDNTDADFIEDDEMMF